jgi:pimeloyl-ACP methyl ester carboxylesterase
MTGERFEVDGLAAVRWGSGPPRYVLLHAGVADSRSWDAVAPALDGPAVAYDRRGFGGTPPGPAAFRHLDDLLAVLDAVAPGLEPVWLVGNSMGGALAIDAALEAPARFAGLVLIGPGVSSEVAGFEAPPQTAAEDAMEAEWKAAGEDVEALLELEAWLWLDGPEHRGRVGGAARELAIDMNRRVHAHGAPDEAGFNGVDGGGRLAELTLPVTVAWGEYENTEQAAICELLVERIPGARRVVLSGTAHLPGLDAPDALVAAIHGTSTPAG